jgi:hypothetical protein
VRCNPSARLLAELAHALHDESDALIANDAARLVEAGSRRTHLLRLLAAVDEGHAVAGPGRSSLTPVGRLALLRAAATD